MNTTCNNCGRELADDQLKPIKDLHQRIAPGEIMPAGECPECGALCHVEHPAQQVIVNVHGGLVQGVFSNATDVEVVVVVDWDQEGVTEDDMEQDECLTTVSGRIVRAYWPTIHHLGAMDDELREAVQSVIG